MELVLAGLVGLLAGVVGGRWLWLCWVPAARAYLHARWVAAVRAAVRMLPPGERAALLGPAGDDRAVWEPEPDSEEGNL